MPEDDRSNTARQSLALCSLFESEILVLLVLKHWSHPLAEDEDFRSDLLENATDILRTATEYYESDPAFIAGLPMRDMNLIAALWYAESCALENPDSESTGAKGAQRRAWLETVKRTLPSCFCPADDLPPNSLQ